MMDSNASTISCILPHPEMNMIRVKSPFLEKAFIKVMEFRVMIQQTWIILMQMILNVKLYEWLLMCASFFLTFLMTIIVHS